MSLDVCTPDDFRNPTAAIPELPKPPEKPERPGVPDAPDVPDAPEALRPLKGSEAANGGVVLGLEAEEGV